MANNERMILKQTYSDTLHNTILKNKYFLNAWKKFENNGYSIHQLQSHHYIETLNLICYAFSCNGGTNIDRILMHSIHDAYTKNSIEIKHAIKTGLGIVILDKNNHVIMAHYGFDYCDKPKYTHLSIKAQKKMDVFEACKLNDKIYCKCVKKREKYIKFGEVYLGGPFAIRPDILHSGLFKIIPNIHIVSAMGYKIFYATQTNPITIASTKDVSKFFHSVTQYNDFSSHSVFDFKNMLNLNDKWFDNEYDKYQFKDVTLLKRNCIVALWSLRFENIPYDYWMKIYHLVLFNVKRSKM